jgi:ClpP class serine protease
MGTMDFIWLLIAFAALQPMLRQRLLMTARQRLIRRIERKRGPRVILLVHRQETMQLLGIPLIRYIDVEDSEAIIDAVASTDPDVPIDLLLHTPGGLVLASYQIARAINRRKGKVTVFVPYYAMSGGTLIALAADEIVMSEHAVLGPTDPQIGKFSAAALLRVMETKPIENIDDETLLLADQAEKAVKQLNAIVQEMLDGKMSAEASAQLAKLLTHGAWTHDYAITCEQATQLGLNVSSELPREFVELMKLFPQPVRRSPSVEYGHEPEPQKAPRRRG